MQTTMGTAVNKIQRRPLSLRKAADAVQTPQTLSAIRTSATILTVCCFAFLTILSLFIMHKYDLGDDAYITARYAQNLANGYGWVWNPGSTPTDGTTAPLWTIILASVKLLHLPFVATTIVLNALTYAAFGTASCKLSGAIAGRLGYAICLICVCALTVLLAWCIGMETSLYGAVVALTFLSWHRGQPRWAFALASLLPLVRGEGILLLGVLYMTIVLQRRVRELWFVAIIALLPLLCWEVSSLWMFHALLPNSFLAKHVTSAGVGGKVNLQTFIAFFWPHAPSVWLGIATVLGLVVARRIETIRVIGLWLTVYVLFYAEVASVPEQGWYILPAWWVSVILIASGLGLGLRRVAGRVPRPELILGTLCGACLVLGLLPAPDLLRREWLSPPPRPDVRREAADYLATHAKGLVAAAEVGVVGYYSHDPVVDMLGLVSPEVVPHLPQRDYGWVIAKEHPRYVFVWPKPEQGSCFEIVCSVWSTPWFRHHYHIVHRWLDQGYVLLELNNDVKTRAN